MTTIYHGTPMTPRAALLDVCKGRAICVSFYRPDDVEAAEAISPAIMYDNGAFSFWKAAQRAGQEWAEDRDWSPYFRLAGTPTIQAGTLGSHPRYAGGTVPAQRRALERVAIRAAGRAALAHGRANQPFADIVREVRPGLSRLDRRGKINRLPRLSRADARGRSGVREPLAGDAHDARDAGGLHLPVSQRGQHITGTERVAV